MNIDSVLESVTNLKKVFNSVNKMTVSNTMVLPGALKCAIVLLFFYLPRVVVAISGPNSGPNPNSDNEFAQIEYYGSHSSGDEYFKGKSQLQRGSE